jgi:aminomethyltransferase
MPLWYPAGARAEHLAVITGAGLFDTSHMAVVTLEGRGARALLQHCFTRDLDPPPDTLPPLVQGRCVYGAFLDEDGGVIDDDGKGARLRGFSRDGYIAPYGQQ